MQWIGRFTIVYGIFLGMITFSPSVRATTLNVPAQYPTIQAGINAAKDGDTVLIADGTFSGNGNRDIDLSGKSITIASKDGAAKTTINCGGVASADGSGNHRGFIVDSGTPIVTISGISIVNAYLSGHTSSMPGGYGAGICALTGLISLQNCTISHNTIVDGFGGGGIFSAVGTTITNCTITNNSAPDGGGVFVDGGQADLSSCIISGNAAPLGWGGGVLLSPPGGIGISTITKCSIVNNSADSGGGLCNENSNGYVTAISDCLIEGNIAGETAFIFGGGGVFNSLASGGETDYINCLLAGNSAPDGGAIYTVKAYESSENDTDDLTVTNCTITSNSAQRGGGIFEYGGSTGDLSLTTTLTNDIIYGDLGGEIYGFQNYLDTYGAWNCDVQGGISKITFNTVDNGNIYPPSVTDNGGNISADPLFVRKPNISASPADYGDLHLTSHSPCLGAGTQSITSFGIDNVIVTCPTNDIDGDIRPNPPSIGAYDWPYPIVQAKLGQPYMMNNQITNGIENVSIPLCFESAKPGPVTIHGEWTLNGKSTPVVITFTLPSSGQWCTPYTYTIPWQQAKGNWTLTFSVDNTNITTGTIQASITGFNPITNGWQFINNFDYIYSNPLSGGYGDLFAWEGLCLGMSREASVYYNSGKSTPQDFPEPSKSVYNEIVNAHLACNAHTLSTDWPRANSYKTDTEMIAGEGDRISTQLSLGRPTVMLLESDRSIISTKHAVLAIGVFNCVDDYNPDAAGYSTNDLIFTVYDPNAPDAVRYVDSTLLDGTYYLNFMPFDSSKPVWLHILAEYTDSNPLKL